MAIEWPARWQHEAKDALLPYFGAELRIRVIVGPLDSIDGTILEGFVYVIDEVPTIIHDRGSGPDVYPWALLAGPVLRIYELRPRRKPTLVFAHTGWAPRHGE